MQDPLILEKAQGMAPAGAQIAEREPKPEEIRTRQLSQLQLIRMRFFRHKPALFGVVVIAFMVAIAIAAGIPQIMPESPYNIFSFDITNQNLAPSFHPAWYFMLGTDNYGHTIVAQIMWGARISLVIGFVGAIATSVVGTLVGAVAGYVGGWTDTVMMRITDIFLTLPFLPILLVAADVFGRGHVPIIIAIFVIFGWSGVARLARSSYLSLRSQEFAEAARAVGVSTPRIIFRHLLPSALRPVIVATTLNIASFIVVEAAIDFLGAGLKYPEVSWGNVLADAQTGFGYGNWWWATFPGVALILTVLAVNFIGDGLGDALDVRSKV